MNDTQKKFAKWVIIFASFVALGVLWNSTTGCQNTKANDEQLNSYYAPSYDLYFNNPTQDTRGARKFILTGASDNWVSLSSVENYFFRLTVLGQTGIKSKMQIGFSPVTLRGVWEKTNPDKGVLQQGTIILIPSTHGGYMVMFKSSDGQRPVKGTFVPNW